MHKGKDAGDSHAREGRSFGSFNLQTGVLGMVKQRLVCLKINLSFGISLFQTFFILAKCKLARRPPQHYNQEIMNEQRISNSAVSVLPMIESS